MEIAGKYRFYLMDMRDLKRSELVINELEPVDCSFAGGVRESFDGGPTANRILLRRHH